MATDHRNITPSEGEKTDKMPAWVPYGTFLINRKLFKSGILAVSTQNIQDQPEADANISQVKLGNRTLQRITEKSKIAPGKQKVAEKALSKAQTILDAMGYNSPPKQTHYLYNDENIYTPEVFLPIQLNNGLGLHAYPWTGKNINLDSNNASNPVAFDTYNTVFCFFGSALKGQDELGSEKSLLKHNIKFYAGQKITQLNYHPSEPHPYEDTIFQDFEMRTIPFILQTKAKDITPTLSCHIPHIDYILFALKLYLHDRMTFDALNAFLKAILLKKDEYVARIESLCKANDIKVVFTCPFSNLFKQELTPENVTTIVINELLIQPKQEQEKTYKGKKPQGTAGNTMAQLLALLAQNQSNEALASVLRQQIDTHAKQFDPTRLSDDDRIIAEKLLVDTCLQKTRQHDDSLNIKAVWSDFTADDDDIRTVEDLLKLGNVVAHGIAAKSASSTPICSILPLSEKQIQLGYNKHQEKVSGYKPAVFITVVDSIIATDSTQTLEDRGKIYYFNGSREHWSNLLKQGLLAGAFKNIGLFGAPDAKQHRQQLTPTLTQSKR